MPEAVKSTKVQKAKPKAAVEKRPKTVKAKPASTAKKVKKVNTVVKALLKAQKAKTQVKVVKTRKPRSPNKPKATGSFAELLTIQAQFETAKLKARKELKREYEDILKKAEKITIQYHGLFGESIDKASKVQKGKGKPAVAKKAKGTKPYTVKEIEMFLEQKSEGIPVKLPGRRAVSVAKLEKAYSQTHESKEILELMSK